MIKIKLKKKKKTCPHFSWHGVGEPSFPLGKKRQIAHNKGGVGGRPGRLQPLVSGKVGMALTVQEV